MVRVNLIRLLNYKLTQICHLLVLGSMRYPWALGDNHSSVRQIVY